MAMSQQLSGINAVNYFSEPIFKSSLKDLSEQYSDFSKYMVAITGLVNFGVTVVSIFTVDCLGRKTSHLTGLTGMAICALIVGILLSDQSGSHSGSCHTGIPQTPYGNITAVVMIFIYVAFFSIGPGAVPWLIAPELFTSSPRPKALAIATTANWLCNFIIALTFKKIESVLCGWVFMIFVGLLLVFIVYLWVRLPNIEGKSVNEIVALFGDRPSPEESSPLLGSLVLGDPKSSKPPNA